MGQGHLSYCTADDEGTIDAAIAGLWGPFVLPQMVWGDHCMHGPRSPRGHIFNWPRGGDILAGVGIDGYRMASRL